MATVNRSAQAEMRVSKWINFLWISFMWINFRGSAANHEIHENLHTMKISMLTVCPSHNQSEGTNCERKTRTN